MIKKNILLLLFISFFGFSYSKDIIINKKTAKEIGNKIWMNECNGSYEGLTSWNKNEDFPSLGIGHFIWFPKDVKNSSFAQTFPSLIWFIKQSGSSHSKIKVPSWINKYAPWKNREQFLKEFNGPRLKQLRKFLADNIDIQVRFMVKRLQEALNVMTKDLNNIEKSIIVKKFYKVAQAPGGLYVLIDYINFKGYGAENTKNYNGAKWGLLQVLQKLDCNSPNILKEFHKAAKKVLIKRILNAPRDERHWWPGWNKRLKTYYKL